MRSIITQILPICLIGMFLSTPALAAEADEPTEEVYRLKCAGTWFPAQADALKNMIDGYLAGAKPEKLPGRPVALIVPHAGYRWSGQVAAAGFKTLIGESYKRVIVLGPSHQAALAGASVPSAAFYETPLGRIPVDADARDALLKCKLVRSLDAAHEGEWSIENEIPFLQQTLKDFRILPIIVGSLGKDDYETLAKVMRPLCDEDTLLVVSSDFTHYGRQYGYVPFKDNVEKNLRDFATRAATPICALDFAGFQKHTDETGDTICGRVPIALALKILSEQKGLEGKELAYDTSGRMTADWKMSVTYEALALYRPGPAEAEGLTEDEQKTLLVLARDVIRAKLGEGIVQLDRGKYHFTDRLKANGAAFVTLKNKGQLRGCIGYIVARGPLYKCVFEMAQAACRDPRFVNQPVTLKELPELSIEISVLSPLKRIKNTDEIELGRDGILVRRGFRQGVFLPQVATETGWTKEQFLENCCAHKAGLAPDAWKDLATEVYTFTAQIFGEDAEAEE